MANKISKGLMSTRRDIFTWLILASVFFIPLQLPVGSTSRLSLADFFVVMASPLLLLRFNVTHRATLIAPLLFPLVMIYGALLGGLVNGQVLPHAMVAKVLGAAVLLFSLLSWLQVAQESYRAIFDLMKAYLLGSVLFTLIGFIELYAGVSIITVRFIESRFSGGYFDPNHYGALTGVGLILVAALGEDIFRRKSSALIVGGILGVGLLLCISRGAWIATTFGLIVVIILRPIKIKAPMIALIALVLIGILFSGVLEHLADNINSRPDNGSHRMELITEGLRLLKEGHFVGIGLSVFLQKNEIIIHNSVIWLLVEMGVVGIALYILFIGEPVVRLMGLRFRHWKKGGRRGDQIARISAALLGAHLLMAVASQLVEATYQRQWWLVLALTVGLLTRTTVTSSISLSTYAYTAGRAGAGWRKWLLLPRLGWPTQWKPLAQWGPLARIAARVNGARNRAGAFNPPVSNSNRVSTDNSDDTSVSDPTVRLNLVVSGSELTDTEQAEQPSNLTNNGSTSDAAKDSAGTNKETDIDTNTQYLPIQEITFTDSESNLAPPPATEKETNVDSETQYLPIQEINFFDSASAATPFQEHDTAAEKESSADDETQYLSIQETNLFGSTNNTSTTEDNIAAAKEASNDSETQYLPIVDATPAEQESNDTDSVNEIAAFNAENSLIEKDAASNNETLREGHTKGPDAELIHIEDESTIKEASAEKKSKRPDSTGHISDIEIILADNKTATEKELIEEYSNLSSRKNGVSIPNLGINLSEGRGDTQAHHALDYGIEELKGIGNYYAQRLREIDIETTQQLLKHAVTPIAIAEIGRQIQSDEALIRSWIGMADLTRIPGIRGKFSELLTLSGVRSIKQLAAQDIHKLTEKISDAYHSDGSNIEATSKGDRYLAKPSIDMVAVWIDTAIKLNGGIPEQESHLPDSTENTSVPADSVIVTEDDVDAYEETNTGAGTKYLSTSDVSQTNENPAEQESIFAKNPKESVTPDAVIFLAEDDITATLASENLDITNDNTDDVEALLAKGESSTGKETSLEMEVQPPSGSDSSLSNGNQPEQKPDHANSTDDTSAPDKNINHVEDDIVVEKETHTTDEKHYLSYSDSFLINDDQIEQTLNQSDRKEDTSPLNTEAILAEGTGSYPTRRTLDYGIREINGIDKNLSQRLHEINIETTQQLLDKAKTPAEIEKISHHIDEEESLVKTWTAIADLIQIPGIRGKFAELITLSGVLSVKQLAAQDAYNFTRKISDSHRIEKKNVEESSKNNRYYAKPSIDMITAWIDSANTLHEQSAEQNLDHLDTTNDIHRSDARVISNEDNASIKKETSTDAATQSLSLADSILFNDEQAEQESNYSNNSDDTSPHKDGVTVSETDIAEEKEMHIDPEIQHLSTDNSILLHKNQTERETSLSESTPDSAALLAKDDIEAEKDIGPETQYPSTQKSNFPDDSNGNASSDVDAIVAESDTVIEEDASLVAKTQYLATQETAPSDNTDDIPHGAGLLVEDDITAEAEEEKNIEAEAQYLSIQETNLSDNASSDTDAIVTESDSATEAEANLVAKTQYLATQEAKLSDNVDNNASSYADAIAAEADNAIGEETNIATKTQYLAIQGIGRSYSTDHIPNTAGILSENYFALQEEKSIVAETRYLSVQETNSSDNAGNNPSSDAAAIFVDAANEDISVEEDANLAAKTQHLATQETDSSDGTNDIPHAAGLLAEDDIAAEAEKNSETETQYLSLPETSLSDNNASSDADAIAAETDNATEEDANLAAKTQHLATQEVGSSDSADNIPHTAGILAEDDIAVEKGGNSEAEAPYLSAQETKLSDNPENSATSDDETIVVNADNTIEEGTDNEISIEKETGIATEAQHLSVQNQHFPIQKSNLSKPQDSAIFDSAPISDDPSAQKPNHPNITATASTPDSSNIPTGKEAIAETGTLHQPISDSMLINKKRAQETNNVDKTNDTSIPNTASLLTENTVESKRRCTLDYDIEEIKGIGEESGQYLRQISIGSTHRLLKQAGNAASIAEISLLVKKEDSLILAWISMADLIRIPGVRGQFAELIALSGVLSVKQLATQDANDLIEKIYNAYRLVQKNRGATARTGHYYAKPNIDMVSTWIDAANALNDED